MRDKLFAKLLLYTLAFAVIAVFALLGYALLMQKGCSALAQEPEPPPPTSADDILYTINHDEDFEIYSVVPPGAGWVAIPLTSHAVVTLAPDQEKHSFFHVSGATQRWYIPIPGSGSRFMRVEASDSALEGIVVFRAAARLRAVNPDGTESAAGVQSEVSWWVARIPQSLGRVIFRGI